MCTVALRVLLLTLLKSLLTKSETTSSSSTTRIPWQATREMPPTPPTTPYNAFDHMARQATKEPNDDDEPPAVIPYLTPYTLKAAIEDIHKQLQRPDVQFATEVLGHTIEYNDLLLVKMSSLKNSSLRFRAEENRYVEEPPEKKIIFIVHALDTNGALRIQCLSTKERLQTLVSFYLEFIDQFDIYLMPMANPDGFVFSQYFQPWHKNNSPQFACQGVNLDRNFDIAFTVRNRTISPCSQFFSGTTPFSEIESRVIRDVFHNYNHKIVAYINVHASTGYSYIYKGDAILYPKGYAEATAAGDDDNYIDLAGEIEEMMKNSSFNTITMTVDSLYSWYGAAFGTSVDYAASVYGIPYAMEFLMQPYWDMSSTFNDYALEYIWHRTIRTVFRVIARSLQDNSGTEEEL